MKKQMTGRGAGSPGPAISRNVKTLYALMNPFNCYSMHNRAFGLVTKR
jgi:hypothetical protein